MGTNPREPAGSWGATNADPVGKDGKKEEQRKDY